MNSILNSGRSVILMPNCYACTSDKGKPRDVAGTRYDLCDSCWAIHLTRNAQAVTEARRQLGKVG